MSFTRGVHLINPELDKVGSEFRTGRRHFSVNKNQSYGLVYQSDDRSQTYATEKPPQQYQSPSNYSQPPVARNGDFEAEQRRSEEVAHLREMIRQRDDELRLLQEQQAFNTQSAPTPQKAYDPEAVQLSRNSNLHEFERARRDDQKRRTAEALAYQLNEKQRVRDLERQAREAEANERLEHLRRMQEDDMQRRLDQRQRASDYRRMLDVQSQSKVMLKAQTTSLARNPMVTDNYLHYAARQEPSSYPQSDYGTAKSYEQNAESFFGADGRDLGRPTYSESPNLRRHPQSYQDTRRLIG